MRFAGLQILAGQSSASAVAGKAKVDPEFETVV